MLPAFPRPGSRRRWLLPVGKGLVERGDFWGLGLVRLLLSIRVLWLRESILLGRGGLRGRMYWIELVREDFESWIMRLYLIPRSFEMGISFALGGWSFGELTIF